MNETYGTYLKGYLPARSMREMAKRISKDPGTLARELRGEVNPYTVADLCRVYERPVVPALIEAGIITAEDIAEMSLDMALQNATDAQLVRETLRRVEAGAASETITEPVPLSLVPDVGGRVQNPDLYTTELNAELIAAAEKQEPPSQEKDNL